MHRSIRSGWTTLRACALALGSLLAAPAAAFAASESVSVTFSVTTREYDRTTDAVAEITNVQVVGDSDGTTTVTLVDASFDNRHVGVGKTVTATFALNANPSGDLFDNGTGVYTSTGTITARPLTVTAATDSKTYDGTTSSVGVPTVTSGTVVAGETTHFAQTFDTRDVGTNKMMVATGNVNNESNYLITFVSVSTGTITKKTLTITAVADDKVYDGGTTASYSSITGNTLGSDVITLTPTSMTFDTRDVGTDKVVTFNGVVIGGAQGGNYTLSADPITALADITARPITIKAVTDTKEYDKTTSSSGTPTITSGALQGGDTLVSATQTFDTVDAGTGKKLTPTATISDGNSGNNYAITFATVSTGEITKRAITVTASSGNDRVYDQTTDTPGSPAITSGSLIAGDTATFDEAYDSKDVGTGKTVTPNGVVSDGNSGGNYEVLFVATTDNQITVETLTVTATAADKDLDGNTTATATLADDRYSGDLLILTYAAANFADRYFGENKTVTVTGIAIAGGADAGNYTLGNTTATTTADIRPAFRLDTGVHVWSTTGGGQLLGGPTTYLIAAELTGDDLIDIVNVTTAGAQVLRNDGGSGTSLTLTLVQELDARWGRGGNAIDVDGDGDLDLVLGDVDHVKIATNDGTGLFTLDNAFKHGFRQPTVAEPYNSRANPLHPDNEVRIAVSSSSDDDVYQDLIGGSSDHRPHLYIMRRGDSGGWQVYKTLASFNVDGIIPHDIDGDGLTDLFVANRSGVWSMTPAYLYRATTSGFTADTTFDLSDFEWPFSFGPTDRVAGTNFGEYRSYSGFAVGTWHRVTVWGGTFFSWNAPLHVSMDPNLAAGYQTGEAWGSAFADMNADGFVDLVAVGRTAPLTMMKLTSDPNAAVNRFVTSLQSGTSQDVKIRDFDFDTNDAPDVIVGRSDGLWYYHNVNGAAAGGGSPAPPASPPTGGEYLSTAIDNLYAALDPGADNPIASDTTTFDNGTAITYLNEAGYEAAIALAHLQKIDPRFRSEVPNFVYGANTTQQIETLRQYHGYIGDALTALSAADALTSDTADEATIASITSTLLSAQADIVAQGTALGGTGVPFKKAAESRAMARLMKKALVRRGAMLAAMAAARNATESKDRARYVQRADRQGERALRYLRKYYKRFDR